VVRAIDAQVGHPDINQLSPTSCIHELMLDTMLAIQSARNTASRRGLNAEAVGDGLTSADVSLIFLEGFATAIYSKFRQALLVKNEEAREEDLGDAHTQQLIAAAPPAPLLEFPTDQYVTKKTGRDVYAMVKNGKECKNP
jgi:hypothetical protein